MSIPDIRDRQSRGNHFSAPNIYGCSVLGAPLECWEASSGETKLLLIAGLHGEEADTTVILSKAFRMLGGQPEDVSVVLCANPDGVARGMRGNASGVDLNRNFPAQNWSAKPANHCWTMDLEESDVLLSPGESAGSEPETQALIELVKKLKPEQIIALHGPLACIDDPDESELARKIAKRTNLPLVSDIGYPTPGSFGSWCGEHLIPIITWEFPPDGIEPMFHSVVPILVDLLRGKLR